MWSCSPVLFDFRKHLRNDFSSNVFGGKHIYYVQAHFRRCSLKVRTSPAILAAFFLVFSSSVRAVPAQTPAKAPPKTPAHTTAHPAPQTLEGSWSGRLLAGDAQLHLVLHISKDADGSWKAAVDSLDQGVYGIEVTSFVRQQSRLKFEVASVGATFEGALSADHQKIEGTWTQGQFALPLDFHRQAASAGSKPANAVAGVEGVWQGVIETSGLRFRVQLHVTHDDKNELLAALDSIDQGVRGLPATHVTEKDAAFHFEIPAVSGSYDGTLNDAKDAISGTWTQSGAEQKLDLKRSEQVFELRRPQNPVKPYPYLEEEVIFPNAKAGVSLAGTLTIPPGSGTFPAAVLICGSGPHDRDESLAGHRPFLVLADFLTRKGVAVLRYDKRGNGKSNGNYAEATSEDFAADVSAAIAYLKTRKEIDGLKIGLIGHSEGGILAPMVAAHSSDVRWIVLLAGPGVKGESILLEQSQLISRAAGLGESQIARSLDFDRKTYALVRQEKDRAALESKLNAMVQSSDLAGSMPLPALKAQIQTMASPWFRFFLDYDPLPALQAIKCPVLALNGEKDLQVPPKDNLPAIRKALESSGSKDFQVSELPGLNHLFQHCQTGSPTEYGAIEETMAPEALNAISVWALNHNTP
jgi:uncharacterized protein